MKDLKKILDDQDSADRFFDYIMSHKKRYYQWNPLPWLRMEMILYQFSFQIGYSYDKDDEQSSIFTIVIGIFALNILW